MDRPTRILIIDDDRVDRELYKRCLLQSHARQFEFLESDSVTVGLEKARSSNPDCILLDFNLPDADGIEAIHQVRGELGTLPAAVIMLTAFGNEELAVRAMQAGAMDYLPKANLTSGTLAHAVLGAIDRHRMQQRIEEQQEAIESSNRRYQILLEAIPQMVWSANSEGRLEYANRRWMEYTGLTMEEAGHFGWDKLLHLDDRDRTLKAWQAAVSSSSVFEIEHRLRRASDASYRWHLVRAVPIRDSSGKTISWFGTCTETEEQKQAEKAFHQKMRLEGIRALAGGVAHDFNNLLMCMMGGASCAMERLPASDPTRDLLRDVVEAGERASELTRKILAYAGKGTFYLEPVNLGDLAQEICNALRPSLPATIRLECAAGNNIPAVETDRTQMSQVVFDLVRNAAEAFRDGDVGSISVRVGFVELNEGSVRRMDLTAPAIAPGNYVALDVRDTGCGIDEETRNKMFEPFFTTKFMGRGLGLAAVGGFVRSHGGGIQVDSVPGKGTCFRMVLPVAQEKVMRNSAI